MPRVKAKAKATTPQEHVCHVPSEGRTCPLIWVQKVGIARSPGEVASTVGRFTAKLTKRKFAFHHSGRRVVALIAAVSWHFGSTRASKSTSRGPKHFA